MHFTNDELTILGISELSFGDDFKKRHTRTIVVDQGLAVLNNSLCSVLLHLNSLNQDVVLLITIVIEEESTINHDWVMFLCNLISLGKIWINIVFSVELYEGWDTTAKS